LKNKIRVKYMKNTIAPTTLTATSHREFEVENPSHSQSDPQLHLSFVTSTCRRRARGRAQILRSRAQGWFDLMRRVVDNAVEWKPAPPARAEQTALDLRRAA
jgi:hypothetical protein